jgi:general stress protein 26
MLYDDHDDNLDFLRQKISSIKIALFKSEFNSELHLPNNIVQTLKVDNDGTVWFFTSCNGSYAKYIDRSFYAYLDYYRKGTDCRLQISGKANIVEDENETLGDDYEKGSYGKLVLVKLKIMQAEFFENRQQATTWTDKLKNMINHLFPAPTHRVYDFSK